MGINSVEQKPSVKHVSKTNAQQKPKEDNFYTVTYDEKGQKKTIKVEKGISLTGTNVKSNSSGNVPIAFNATGKNNVSLDNLSPTQIFMLKKIEMADGKAGITKADLQKLADMYYNGKYVDYVNKNAPGTSKVRKNSETEGIYKDYFDVNMYDSKKDRIYGITAKLDVKH